MTAITGFSAVSATGATVNLSNYGADGTLDIQVGSRDDFQFCVCPVYNVGRAGAVSLPGLNQRSTYWVRARNRAAAGIEDWSAAEAVRTSDGSARYTVPQDVMISPAALVLPEKPIAITSSGEISGFPVVNLLRDAPVAWHGYQSGGQFQILLRMAGQPVDTIALLNSNLPEAATVQITGGASQAAALAGSDFSTGAMPFRASPNIDQRAGYHGLFPLGPVRTSIWYAVTIQNADLPAGMIHLEHLVIGLNRVSRNIGGDKTETSTTLTTIDRKRSGIPDRVRGMPMRKVDFEVDMVTEAQFETLYAQLWRRENEAVLAVPNSRVGAFLHDRILYGDLSGGRATTSGARFHSRQFTINSLI